MRILYIDMDSTRPDHLGCYGYHRNTSPNIDALAAEGTRFENCYVSDAPCLPSRSALWTGRCGFHTGVVNHGGTAGQPFVEGAARDFSDIFGKTGWMAALRETGHYTATVSSFGERHSAWHWYAGYNEIINPGKTGMDIADDVTPRALTWLDEHAETENWFLHVNYWDPHTPFRTPESFGNPFADDPLPTWLADEVIEKLWGGFGPHSPQEPHGFADKEIWYEFFYKQFPNNPDQLDSPETVKKWIDMYDTGIRYVDTHIGYLLDNLKEKGVLDDTMIVISADHGENHGELNIWGDHQTADSITSRVPLVVREPSKKRDAYVDSALHYHFDWAATLIELTGGKVPENWDGQPFTEAFLDGKEEGRPYLVTSQQTWSCQRGVRFGDYMFLRTYHDGYKEIEPIMLWDLKNDPHEQHDLSKERPELVERALSMLAEWYGEMALTSEYNVDPMMTVLREGGPFHTRGRLPNYLKRLRETGREQHAERLERLHPDEA